MAVEDTSGVDVEEGVGVEVVGGVVLEEVDKGVDEVLSIEEERVLEVSGVLLETGVELLLAIELDGGTEVLVGDDGVWVDVVGTPVSVLVELVDMVNCLLNTSFLGRLYVAMSAKRNLIMVGCHHVYLQHSRRCGASYLKPGSTYANAAATQRVLVVKAEATMFRVWKERRTCSWRDCCFAFTGGLTAGDRWADG